MPLTPAQMFFCEYCEILKNNIFYRTSLVTAFAIRWSIKTQNENFKQNLTGIFPVSWSTF